MLGKERLVTRNAVQYVVQMIRHEPGQRKKITAYAAVIYGRKRQRYLALVLAWRVESTDRAGVGGGSQG